ncbi:transmembrane amino acid transporter protein [Cystoisospora suis]|uniref:Transmembrane amino acid transporter protein n=1 Tax=Cystoisospora suis TaxID=483139 RepID=A0A2C6KSM7_9APIC|nr:transmembrane amino acid transporter protein [Cystoisospora suis]
MTVQCVRAEQDPDHLNSFHEEPLRSCVVGFTGQSDECPTSVDRSIELASLVGDEACREVASTGTGTDSSGGPAEEGSGICRSCPPSSHDAERKCLTQHGKSMGAFGTSAVICKAFMGSVFIFLPYAVVKGGLVLSLLTLGGVMVLSVYCMQLLIDCCVRGTSDTYELIAERALGRWGRVLVEGCVFFSQVAFCTVYVVVAARNLRDVLRSLSSCSPDRDISVTVLIWSLGLYFLPLSFVRNMSYLVPLMLIGNAGTISGMCILCVAVTLHVSGQTGETNSFDFFNFGGWSLILGTSVYVWLVLRAGASDGKVPERTVRG